MLKLNRNGFTLVELLAVLVILSAIMGIALPSITSSLERNKSKQNDSKKAMLESFAEIYVMDHKNAIYDKLNNKDNVDPNKDRCYITISSLKTGNYLTEDALEDADGNQISGNIMFDRSDNSYIYSENLVFKKGDTTITLVLNNDECN